MGSRLLKITGIVILLTSYGASVGFSSDLNREENKDNPRPIFQYLKKPENVTYSLGSIAILVNKYWDMFTPVGLKGEKTKFFEENEGKSVLVASPLSLKRSINLLEDHLNYLKDLQSPVIANILRQLEECKNFIDTRRNYTPAGHPFNTLKGDHGSLLTGNLETPDIKNLVEALPEDKDLNSPKTKLKNNYRNQLEEGKGKIGKIYHDKIYGPILTGLPSNKKENAFKDIVNFVNYLSDGTVNKEKLQEWAENVTERRFDYPNENLDMPRLTKNLEGIPILNHANSSAFVTERLTLKKDLNGYMFELEHPYYVKPFREVIDYYANEKKTQLVIYPIIKEVISLLEIKLKGLKEVFPKMRIIRSEDLEQQLKLDPNLPNNLCIIIVHRSWVVADTDQIQIKFLLAPFK